MFLHHGQCGWGDRRRRCRWQVTCEPWVLCGVEAEAGEGDILGLFPYARLWIGVPAVLAHGCDVEGIMECCPRQSGKPERWYVLPWREEGVEVLCLPPTRLSWRRRQRPRYLQVLQHLSVNQGSFKNKILGVNCELWTVKASTGRWCSTLPSDVNQKNI